MVDVFISYARRDEAAGAAIEAEGYETWSVDAVQSGWLRAEAPFQ